MQEAVALNHPMRSDVDPAFRADVLAGLAAPIPAIPARWLYDRRGSELFEAITRLPEYYPTRAERKLLEERSAEVAGVIGGGSVVVEFGSGSSAKTPLLLRAVRPAAYVPIDISGDFLRDSAAELSADFPGVRVEPLEADFMKPLTLPGGLPCGPRLGFFPGSTIGNMIAATAVDLLRAMRRTLGTGASLLIGMDRIKDVDVLLRAYDDAAGVTAQFNLNLLHRINDELRGTIPIDAFRHRAIWNDALARIEMHLEAVKDVRFTVEDQCFAFAAGATIHSENSHKYGLRDGRMLLHAGGWTPLREWVNEEEPFALILARAEPERFAP